MTNLDQLKQRRPARREAVDAHKNRMIAETRAYFSRDRDTESEPEPQTA